MELWDTMVPAKASVMVSFLATRPWIWSQVLEDMSEELRTQTVEFKNVQLSRSPTKAEQTVLLRSEHSRVVTNLVPISTEAF